jgi:isopenicillin-N epimerase
MELGSTSVKSLFMLDPNIIHLNHGSFGACPKLIFDSLVKWQKLLEREPVKHLAFDIFEHLEKSREALSLYVKCHKDDIVFFPNPSTALNTVLRSLDLKNGDEILTTNHEYGAMDRAWRFLCRKTGAVYINQDIPLPLLSKEHFIHEFKKGISEQTKVIFLSHITSPTALIFPVKEICDIAREKNIITIIDGAHAPAQLDLDISDINPDFYSGACHKWMCSPKGVAFLYVNKNFQDKIEPLVVSWGYEAENPGHSQFLDYLQWQGTYDMSAYLTIPDTIDFLNKNHWCNITKQCHKLNVWAKDRILQEFDIQPICDSMFLGQMSSVEFPFSDPLKNQMEFYARYKIQIPFWNWHDKTIFRISIQAYNSKQDIYMLIDALKDYQSTS